MAGAAPSLENDGNPPAIHQVPPITRRTWLQQASEWAAKGAILKQIGAAVGGVASGGAAVYGYAVPKLRALSEKDFVVGDDATGILLDAATQYVKVKISRKFTQQAIKSGYYKYQRFCEGSWVDAECSMLLRKANGSTEPVKFAIYPDNQDGEVLSVIEPADQKPIHISKGDDLEISLVSEENIEKVKGGYRLRLNAQFKKSSFTLNATPATRAAILPQAVNCLVYAEKQSQVLVPIHLDMPITLSHCTSGLEYLISWVS